MKIDKSRLIELPKILDERGNLTFLEESNQVPFPIERVYWIYDVPGGEVRGGHAYKKLNELVIALSGSFDVILDDGKDQKTVTLNRSYTGLFIPQMMWRQIENFSTNALALIIADGAYDSDDYIRDYKAYQSMNI